MTPSGADLPVVAAAAAAAAAAAGRGCGGCQLRTTVSLIRRRRLRSGKHDGSPHPRTASLANTRDAPFNEIEKYRSVPSDDMT